jgi:hypothetical protein
MQNVLPALLDHYPREQIEEIVKDIVLGETGRDRTAAIADLIETFIEVILTDEEKHQGQEVVLSAAMVCYEVLAAGWACPKNESQLPQDEAMILGVRMGEPNERTMDPKVFREWFQSGSKVYWRPWIGDPVDF